MALGSELRRALIGTWLLESYVESDSATGAPNYRLGISPRGIIMYTPDGCMPAQLQKSSWTAFAGSDMYVEICGHHG